MKLAEILTEDRIFLNLKAGSCSCVMEELVDHFEAEGILLNGMRDQALNELQCRQDEISTGVGCGVAIPHAYLEEIAEPVAIFARSKEGIEFDSCDHAPVHFVIMLLIPKSKKGQHLLTLADIGKRFLSCDVRQSLAEATDKQTVMAILDK